MEPMNFYRFETVTKNSAAFSIVEEQFNNVIVPIYGDQQSALEKIATATDRVCEVLINSQHNSVVGIIVYKNEPTDEFSPFGVQRALELKTLFVINAACESGKGIGSQLIDKVKKAASDARFGSIAVTVSNEKPESQEFFKKKGFREMARFEDKYKRGATETLYAYDMP